MKRFDAGYYTGGVSMIAYSVLRNLDVGWGWLIAWLFVALLVCALVRRHVNA